MAIKNPQEQHYERIHDAYTAHYFDPCASDYRKRFIVGALFDGQDLSGQRIADLAAGSGFNSLLLHEIWPSAETVGFDISARACKAYEANVGSAARHVDLSVDQDFEPEFDTILVIGGLHHCVNDLPATLRNVARLLKPGGRLFFYEPNADFLLQRLRDWWYRRDAYFDHATERALTYEELLGLGQKHFEPERILYLGGPAYFLVLNSLITRVPLRSKRVLAALLFPIEKLWNTLGSRHGCPAVAAVWRRNADPVH